MIEFKQRKMCSACPFRPDAAAGWLGSYTPEEVLADIRNEIPFLCHQQVEAQIGYEKADWQDQAEQQGVDHCAGALVFAKKCGKSPRDPQHNLAVQTINTKVEILFPPPVFLEHHTIKKKKPARRQKPGTAPYPAVEQPLAAQLEQAIKRTIDEFVPLHRLPEAASCEMTAECLEQILFGVRLRLEKFNRTSTHDNH